MNRRHFHLRLSAGLGLAAGLPACTHLGHAQVASPLQPQVDQIIQTLMQEHGIPGMAVGIVSPSRRDLFHYGVASRQSRQPVTPDTLFEIGSVSKTFTGLLGGYAASLGKLAWTDRVGQHFAALQGSELGMATMLDLATYTAGGLPLQVPEHVDDQAKMVAFYRDWRPAFPAGTHRQYSNASIGLFGHLAAQRLGAPFQELMEGNIFPALGLRNTFLQVPPQRASDYAWGEREGRPVRVSPGLWDAQAYGVKTTAADLLRFVQLNLDARALAPALQQAVALSHTGHYRVGAMHQGLGWELYGSTSSLDDLLAGNSTEMALQARPVVRHEAATFASKDMLINKTGSTNGFGAYALLQPSRAAGVVMLANKNYPNAARVKAAHRLFALAG